MEDTGADPASSGEASPDAGWRKLGAPAGLCETCRHGKLNQTRKGTAYLRCTRAAWDDRLPRYPRLPVARCPGYEQAGQEETGYDSYSPA